ncbi:MAG TPA: sigma-70 family RNA polymerase sigma factor, partial [Blastocatellia bacterium]|nr:sigma-70 family RNA polymerase sigma factor [Blastocatellia bacterium]
MREPDAAAIIEACKQGDRAAFHSLFEIYKDRVYSIALHFSGNESAAHDVTQQVFLKLFRVITQFQHESAFTTWLYRIVANACADEQRKDRRWVPLTDGIEVRAMFGGASQEDNYVR